MMRTMGAALILFGGLLVLAGCGDKTSTTDPSTGDALPSATADAASDATKEPPSGDDSTGTIRDDAKTAKDPSAPEVTLETVDRAGFDEVLAEHRGKIVYVDFWATWCLSCRKNFHHNVEWAKEYGDDGLVVVTMSMDDPTDEATRQEILKVLNKEQATETVNLLSAVDGEEGFLAYSIADGALPHYKIYGPDGTLLKTFETVEVDFVEQAPLPSEVKAAVEDALKNLKASP